MNSLSRLTPSLFDLPLFDLAPRADVWLPTLDVRETDTAYEVQAEIPGIPPEAVDVTVENGLLTVSGEKSQEIRQDDGNGRVHHVERSYGKFVRKVKLPRNVDPEGVTAIAANGVLTITIPKGELPKKIKIDVKPN